MMDRKGIGGRPRERAEAKKAPLSLRTDPGLRAEILSRAKAHGLSLTQEIERLLRRALDLDAA